MEQIPTPPPTNPEHPAPAAELDPAAAAAAAESLRQQRQIIIGAIIFVVLLLGGVGVSIWLLAQPGTDADRVRDIFIIFMALQSLLIGVVLIILIIQLARLINLLQNEIKPILESTNQTASTLRGTARFLSDNLSEPVIKLNESLAAIQRLLELLGIGRRP